MFSSRGDGFDKGIYYIILGRYLLKALGLYLKLSDHVIEAYDGHFKGSTGPIVGLGRYEFKDLNIGKITPKEFFMDSYAGEINELEIYFSF